MDALRFSFRERTLELNRMDIPAISEPNEILIKVAYAGICGTDLHILAGEFPCRQVSDITLGHEISGVIVEVGTDVINYEEGDKVTVDPNSGCKRCSFCHAGKPHFCKVGCTTNTIGIYRDGGWAQYVICPEEQVYKISTTTTLEQAVLAEPLSCLAHGWDIISPVTIGDKILLLGAGIVGILWACALHLQGHKNVTVSEPNTARLDMLRKLNTGYALVTPDQLTKSQEASSKYVFDVVIDCSGFTPAIEQGISLLNSGGKLCIFGVAPPTNKISISPYEIFYKELQIRGVNINPFTFTKALGMIEALGNRYLNYNMLGIKTFPLNQYQEAIDMLKKGAISKAIFKM
ncbi:hypothetical protein MTP99_005692 [Tenebrio molitor]|uniref:uncharacterized protein n=1 Tax=Tenebrio molitor TaxID=7067 RepID=UPI001C3B8267|nr:hypothetical protein MTP99_005692 [Tenebrio molitor]CAH1381757.1 unnamed protein product [Tenebrio molitor]